MTILAMSADSHVTEPGDCYVDRIDARFRERAPVATTDDTMGAVMVVDNDHSRVPYGMIAAAGRPAEVIGPFEHVGWDELHPGGWDPAAVASRGWQASLTVLRAAAEALIVVVAFSWWLVPFVALGAYFWVHRRRTPAATSPSAASPSGPAPSGPATSGPAAAQA